MNATNKSKRQPWAHSMVQSIGWLPKRKMLILGLVFVIGSLLRLYAAARGSNADFDSYVIVKNIMHHGGNVYAETTRYNYGPVWFNLLHMFDGLARFLNGGHDSPHIFRIFLVGFLTTVDMLIALILARRFSLLAASLFFLNPISIAITGFGNQFDNVAVLLVLLAMLAYEKVEKHGAPKLYAVAGIGLLIGLSLSVKHVFLFLPVWLFFHARRWSHKILLAAVPYAVFFGLFIPYWAQGSEGIIQNVFKYKSYDNAPFYSFILPPFIHGLLSAMLLFVIAMLCTGIIVRKQPAVKLVLIYTIALVIFAPAIANQYLAIPMPALAVFCSVLFVPYILLASGLIWATSHDGVMLDWVKQLLPQHIQRLIPGVNYPGPPPINAFNWIIVSLFLGTVLYLGEKRLFVLDRVRKLYARNMRT